jgi:hypothetical protein
LNGIHLSMGFNPPWPELEAEVRRAGVIYLAEEGSAVQLAVRCELPNREPNETVLIRLELPDGDMNEVVIAEVPLAAFCAAVERLRRAYPPLGGGRNV